MDFYQGKASVEKALPIGTILTIAAAGSEGSPNTVITDEKTMVKKGTKSDLLRPKFSILNRNLPVPCLRISRQREQRIS